MKLSKDDLFYIFDCADDPDRCVQGGLDMDDVKNAFIEGTLEIEGYEQSKWTRFDPKDKSTFPDNLTPVLICYKNGKVHEEFYWAKGEFGVNIDPTTITHWRPLPKPPGKEGK